MNLVVWFTQMCQQHGKNLHSVHHVYRASRGVSPVPIVVCSQWRGHRGHVGGQEGGTGKGSLFSSL